MAVDLTLRSKEVVVSKVIKKTRAKVFENFEVGDAIQLSVKPKGVGGSRGRTYAVDVKVENITKNEYTYKTFNQLTPLNNFEFEERV